jgi:hypothetical protein
MQQDRKTLGIVLTVIGGAIALWVISRFTSIMGKLCSWGPPFSGYEVTTIIGVIVAIILIIVGIISIMKKQ